jgi:hypothetical protein
MQPKRVFDFGFGAGKYGEFVHQETKGIAFGCDVWKPAIDVQNMFCNKYKYQEVYLEDIRVAVHGEVAQSCDLWIFGDVLEHLPKEDVTNVLGAVLDRNVIIAIPIGEYPQGELYGNSAEKHLWSCSVDDVKSWPLEMSFSLVNDCGFDIAYLRHHPV